MQLRLPNMSSKN